MLPALVVLYLFKIGSLIRGDGFRESIEYLGINGLSDLNSDISYGPIKFLQLLMVKIDEPNSTLLRLVSATLVIGSVILFYRLMRKWHTPRIAILSSILFATSSYSLHMGRYSLATASLMLVFPALLLFGTWLKSKRNVQKIIFIGPATALSLYIPGIYIVILALVLIFRQRLLLAVQHMKRTQLYMGMSATGLVLLPLILAIIQNPNNLKYLSGLDSIPRSFKAFYDSLAQLPIDFVYSANIEGYKWLTGSPILDVASIILLILGTYAYIRGEHPLRIRLIGIGVGLSWFIIMFSSTIDYALILPLVYVVIANGIAYLLQTWFTVFPKNPAARRTGVITVAILVLAISAFHGYRFFEVWPNTPETKESVVLQDPQK